MSVLVTGAAGFIGSHVAERLLEGGESVVSIDSFDGFYDPRRKEANLVRARSHDHFRDVRGDIRDRALLDSLPDDIEAVVHLAARAGVRPSIESPLEYESVNVTGTLTLLEWMQRRGIKRLAFASSSSVYGNDCAVPFSEDAHVARPISPYAATKLSGELLCHVFHHLHGLSTVALRLFTVYGPRQRPDLAIHKFARLIRAGQPITVFGDGSTQRDYTFIDDIVDGIVASLELLGEAGECFEIINLGASRVVALDDLIRVLGDEMGVVPDIVRTPPQPGDVVRTLADISKAERLLGYRPRTPLRTGIREFLEWSEGSSQTT